MQTHRHTHPLIVAAAFVSCVTPNHHLTHPKKKKGLLGGEGGGHPNCLTANPQHSPYCLVRLRIKSGFPICSRKGSLLNCRGFKCPSVTFPTHPPVYRIQARMLGWEGRREREKEEKKLAQAQPPPYLSMVLAQPVILLRPFEPPVLIQSMSKERPAASRDRSVSCTGGQFGTEV